MLSVQSARQLKNMLLYKFIVIVEKKKTKHNSNNNYKIFEGKKKQSAKYRKSD